MEEHDLCLSAERNRKVFDDVLASYVTTKLERVLSQLPRKARSGWFDASGCVWCLFDDEGFTCSGDAGRRLRDEQLGGCSLQVYWSMGDVMMPEECDERWVAGRIAAEAERQLSAQGYRCATEEREVDGEIHLGVRFRKRLLSW